MAEKLKPGDYIGLYLDNILIYTGVLKDIGQMESGRTIYQVLLVKNIFQRNYPEIHFSDKADVRKVSFEDVKAEIRRLKINLQKNIEKMESENVAELIATEEWHSIVG
ncbi:MAG: hypothetical protein AB1649_05515 [Chloroflexota bacterium]